jgi:hypothetical protein
MSKFAKRMKKINKNFRNVLVIGSAFGNLQDLIDTAQTVFVVYPKDDTVRAKNLIYREELDSANILTDIDFVFIDEEYVHVLPNLQQLWRCAIATIMIEGSVGNSVDYYKFMKSLRYQVIDIRKDYHVWQIK